MLTNADVAARPESCDTCGGCGKVRIFGPGTSINITCPHCDGSGKK